MAEDAVIKKADSDNNEHGQAHSIEKLLENLGYCGRFQIVFVLLGYFPLLPAAWSMMLMAFGNYNPGWKCHDEVSFNLTESIKYLDKVELSITRNETNFIEQSNSQMCARMRFCKNLTFNNLASTIVSEWALVCENSRVPLFIISIQMVGVTLGAYIGGQIGDKFGRKFSIHGSSALLVLTNIIAIFSVSWKMYAAVLFFVGFASGCCLSSAVVYVFEFIQMKWRGILGICPVWNFTTMTFSLCVMALKNWRYVHIANALVALIAFLPVCWLPESMRFLTVHGKVGRANKVVRKIARLNKKAIPDTTILNVVAEKEKRDVKNKRNYTYLDLFHKNIRKFSIVLGMTWFILSIGYSMMAFGIKALSGDFFVNFLLFCTLPVPMRIVAVVLATRVGRKVTCTTFVGAACLCSFSLVAIQLLLTGESRDLATLVLALGTNIMVEASWGAVVVLGMELIPTGVRNLSYGYFVGLARTASVISPFLIPKETLPVYGAFLCLGVLLLSSFIGLLTLPETIGRPLQDNFKTSAATEEDVHISGTRFSN